MKKMKKNFSSRKLNQKFSVVILLVLGVCLVFFTINSFRTTENMMFEQRVSEVWRWLDEDEAAIEKMVELCYISSQIFIEDRELQDFLSALKNGEQMSPAQYYEFFKNHVNPMESLVNSNIYLYQIRIYACNDDFPEMDPILYHGDRLKDFPWAKDFESGSWQIDYPDYLISPNDDHRLISLVSEMNDQRGELVGVVEAAATVEDMFPRIYESNRESWSCFVQEDGTIVSMSDSPWEPYREDIVAAAADIGSSGYVHTNIGGDDVLIVQRHLDYFPGTYICLSNLSQQSGQMILQQIQNLLIIVLVFLVLIIVINVTVKRLFRRFHVTMAVIRKVQDGHLDERVPVSGSDEFSELGSQINAMLDNIQVLMREKIQQEVLVKNTEIKALQNQINAHFIYNVLESIKMMAEIDEKYEISDAITALGELLRYNLKWVSSNVTIREEVAYIRNYIRLMNLRYDFAIILSVNIDDDIYSQSIPKMSLQPIVENAILHGIAELGEDATIYIKSMKTGNDFEITITDSGVGMDEEQRLSLEKKINGELDDPDSKHGIGLKNVNYRIKMQFGDRYGLKIYSMEGCYTKISVLLPFVPQSKKNAQEHSYGYSLLRNGSGGSVLPKQPESKKDCEPEGGDHADTVNR